MLSFCVKPYQAFCCNLVHIKLVFQIKISKLFHLRHIDDKINQLRTFGSLSKNNKIALKYIYSS